MAKKFTPKVVNGKLKNLKSTVVRKRVEDEIDLEKIQMPLIDAITVSDFIASTFTRSSKAEVSLFRAIRQYKRWCTLNQVVPVSDDIIEAYLDGIFQPRYVKNQFCSEDEFYKAYYAAFYVAPAADRNTDYERFIDVVDRKMIKSVGDTNE